MKRICLFLGIALAVHSGYAQKETGTVQFKVKNFGFNVSGSFTDGIGGTIHFNPDSLSTASFDVTIKASGINTDNDLRDTHLRDETYFDVKNFPLIHFVSETIKASGKKGMYMVTGKLTIKNHTKELSFPFSAVRSGSGYALSGSFKINRRDFAVGGSSTVSDDVEVNLAVMAK